MSNQQNDTLRERLFEQAQDIVSQMIEDGELNLEIKEETTEEIYQQLYEEKDFSIEDQTDDDSGEEL